MKQNPKIIAIYVVIFICLFLLVHMGTMWFLRQSSPPNWLFITSFLGMILGYGDERFVIIGDLITASIIFPIILAIINGFFRKG